MILYFVRYQTFQHPGHVLTDNWGPWDYWHSAKERRNDLFKARPNHLRRCWVEATEDGLTIKRAGAVLCHD